MGNKSKIRGNQAAPPAGYVRAHAEGGKIPYKQLIEAYEYATESKRHTPVEDLIHAYCRMHGIIDSSKFKMRQSIYMVSPGRLEFALRHGTLVHATRLYRLLKPTMRLIRDKRKRMAAMDRAPNVPTRYL